jgi:hypothetical protein
MTTTSSFYSSQTSGEQPTTSTPTMVEGKQFSALVLVADGSEEIETVTPLE